MEIHTGITEDEDGRQEVGLRIQEDEDDRDPLTIVMPPDLARMVAFNLVEEADRIEPPAWREDTP